MYFIIIAIVYCYHSYASFCTNRVNKDEYYDNGRFSCNRVIIYDATTMTTSTTQKNANEMYQITHITGRVPCAVCLRPIALLFIWQRPFFGLSTIDNAQTFSLFTMFFPYSPPLVQCHLFYSFIRLENNLFSSTSFYYSTPLFTGYACFIVVVMLAECIPASVAAYSRIVYLEFC